MDNKWTERNIKRKKQIDMERLEELIEKFKPINAHQIENFYTEKFAISVLKLLMKLGVEEKEVYYFDERKKRLRGLDKLNYIDNAMIGVAYFCVHKSTFDTIEVDGQFYEFFWYFMDDLYGNQVENCSPLQITELDTWASIYNYLRIEANSKKGK